MDGIILSETKNNKNVLCTLAVLLIVLFICEKIVALQLKCIILENLIMNSVQLLLTLYIRLIMI